MAYGFRFEFSPQALRLGEGASQKIMMTEAFGNVAGSGHFRALHACDNRRGIVFSGKY